MEFNLEVFQDGGTMVKVLGHPRYGFVKLKVNTLHTVNRLEH